MKRKLEAFMIVHLAVLSALFIHEQRYGHAAIVVGGMVVVSGGVRLAYLLWRRATFALSSIIANRAYVKRHGSQG